MEENNKQKIYFWLILFLMGSLGMGLGSLKIAQANTYSRGDVQSILNNYPPGKNIYYRQWPNLEADPTAPIPDIRPFEGFYDNLTYCEDDWHVLALMWDAPVFFPADPRVPMDPKDPQYEACYNCPIQYLGFSPGSNKLDSSIWLDNLYAEFQLDGEAIPDLTKTPIKRMLDEGSVDFQYGQAWYEFVRRACECEAQIEVYAVQFGRVMAPEELPAGTHTLQVTVSTPFQVDPLFWGYIEFDVLSPEASECRSPSNPFNGH